MTGDYYPNSDFDCRLCGEIHYFGSSLFARTYPGILDRNAFFETPQLQVMIPVGPLCEGHLLVVSKAHAFSFGHVVRNVLPELSLLLARLSKSMERRFGRTVIFEHGPMSQIRRGGCCLDHAHLNLLPIPDSLKLYDSVSKFIAFTPTQLEELEDFVDQDEPYLFFRCSREGSFGAPSPNGSGQFFRKVLARAIGVTTWDWSADPRVEVVHKTLEMVRREDSINRSEALAFPGSAGAETPD